MTWMLVLGPTWSTVVRATSHEKAKQRVLDEFGFNRPELARDWRVRLATPEEVRRHEQVMAKLAKPVDGVHLMDWGEQLSFE